MFHAASWITFPVILVPTQYIQLQLLCSYRFQYMHEISTAQNTPASFTVYCVPVSLVYIYAQICSYQICLIPISHMQSHASASCRLCTYVAICFMQIYVATACIAPCMTIFSIHVNNIPSIQQCIQTITSGCSRQNLLKLLNSKLISWYVRTPIVVQLTQWLTTQCD